MIQPKPYYQNETSTLHLGNCLEVLLLLPENSVDAVITDPPYDLTAGKKGGTGEASVNLDSPYGRARITTGFMGKSWDGTGVAFKPETWAAIMRVMKPGAHLLAFGGTRTYHRMVCAIEDAGLEIRDDIDFWYDANPIFAAFYDSLNDEQKALLHQSAGASHLSWLYGSGFPKSLRVSTDERFCHCDASERTSSGTFRERETEDHRHTAKPLDEAARVAQSVPSANRKAQGSQGRYHPESRSDDEPLPPAQADGQSSSPLREYAQAHSRSFEREDDPAGESLRSPSQAQHNARPSSRDSGRPSLSDSDEHCDMRANKAELGNTPTLTDSAVWEFRIPHKVLQSSAFPLDCSTCGKPDAKGFGTALKPAHEPIVLARKPLIGTVAENVLAHGTGGLNVDGCRIETSDVYSYPNGPGGCKSSTFAYQDRATTPAESNALGRWPANVIHDGSDEVVMLFPDVNAGGPRSGQNGADRAQGSPFGDGWNVGLTHGDRGSAARFFYTAKASKDDRDEGLEDLALQKAETMNDYARPSEGRTADKNGGLRRNHHPTVKPTDLMRYLCRLVTQPGGIVLDPFMGSGSTGKAAYLEGLRFIGIEQDESYCQIAARRCAVRQRSLFAAKEVER